VAWVPARRRYVPARGSLRLPAVDVPLPPAGRSVLGGVALAVMVSAFVARGGTQLGRTTWVEILLMLTGAALCAAALLAPRNPRAPERLRGIWLLAAFALLTVLTAASISWSLTPSESWLETNRMLAYLGVLAGGVALGRLVPGRWAALLGAIALSSVLLCTWSLITKIVPAALAGDEMFARLRSPFDYWNSVGLAAALGIPPTLWLAVRRSGHAAVNVLAWPALGIQTLCLLMAYSRGSLLAIGVGLAIFLAFIPLRLRAFATLGGVLVSTVPLVAWAFAQEGLTVDRTALPVRVDAGLAFGGLLLLLISTLTVSGALVGFLAAHHGPGERGRSRATRARVATLVAVPAGAIRMLANAPGGIDGQISKAWHQATDPSAKVPGNSPDRLKEASSMRARYWEQAYKVHSQHPLLGAGAGSYSQLRLHYRDNLAIVRHAHGYVLQVLSDLGWVGLGLSLLATLTWFAAAFRVLGAPRRRELRLPWDAERVGVATLAVVVIVFGVHSAIDWTWYVPGNAVPALLCAGFVASRMTLRERYFDGPQPASEPLPEVRFAVAGLVVLLALTAAWAALQPVRSVNATDEALNRVALGQLPAARSIARIAHDRNPLAVEPLFQLSAIEVASGNVPAAKVALDQAIELEPANPETWRHVGRLRLRQLNDPKGALRAFQYAYYLDPYAPQSLNDVLVASRVVNGG
jgi:tetratricopeptide (TPR) repeat protein